MCVTDFIQVISVISVIYEQTWTQLEVYECVVVIVVVVALSVVLNEFDSAAMVKIFVLLCMNLNPACVHMSKTTRHVVAQSEALPWCYVRRDSQSALRADVHTDRGHRQQHKPQTNASFRGARAELCV